MNENESELKSRLDDLSRQVRRLRHIVLGGSCFLVAFAVPVVSVITPRGLLVDGTMFGLFALGVYPVVAAVWGRLSQPRASHEN